MSGLPYPLVRIHTTPWARARLSTDDYALIEAEALMVEAEHVHLSADTAGGPWRARLDDDASVATFAGPMAAFRLSVDRRAPR